MWAELIALGLDPTCSLFYFLSLHVGPTLFRGKRSGVVASFALVGRAQQTRGVAAPGN